MGRSSKRGLSSAISGDFVSRPASDRIAAENRELEAENRARDRQIQEQQITILKNSLASGSLLG